MGRVGSQDVGERASMPASRPACCSSRAASCAAAAPASRCAEAAFAFALCSSCGERKTKLRRLKVLSLNHRLCPSQALAQA